MGETFKILIIEDGPEKGAAVKEKISAAAREVPTQIELVPNLHGALKKLEATYFDLVILDIRIPAATIGPRAENSRVIIEQLASGQLIMPACVVGLTAFEEEYKAEFAYFTENLLSLERYDPNDDTWVRNIANRIRFVARWRSAFARAHNFAYGSDLLILVARTENEYKPILDAIE
jgi:CheY-like chemotaxis protein